MRLLLASQNSNKQREMQELLKDLQIEVLLPDQAGISKEFDVEETGQTFQENAELKARAFSAASGLPTLADDSGIMVTALNGAPGVYSKRFAPGTDHDRNLFLLKKIKTAKDRSAQFVSVLCLYQPDTKTAKCFEGVVTGHLDVVERGTAGFGYDPLFIPDGYDQSFGELGQKVKNKLSHRARALAKFIAYLKTQQ